MNPWTIAKWIARLVAVSAIVLAMWAVWHTVDHWCNAACAAPTKELAALKEKVAAEDEARRVALAIREKEDADARQALEAAAAAAQRERDAALARSAALERRAKDVEAKLEAKRGECLLPPDARSLWNESIGPDAGRGAASGSAPAAPGAPDAPRAAAAGPAGEVGVAPSERDAAPADCVDVYRVGRRNTIAADFNADELDRCYVDSIKRWEWQSGKKYPYDELAPWLKP